MPYSVVQNVPVAVDLYFAEPNWLISLLLSDSVEIPSFVLFSVCYHTGVRVLFLHFSGPVLTESLYMWTLCTEYIWLLLLSVRIRASIQRLSKDSDKRCSALHQPASILPHLLHLQSHVSIFRSPILVNWGISKEKDRLDLFLCIDARGRTNDFLAGGRQGPERLCTRGAWLSACLASGTVWHWVLDIMFEDRWLGTVRVRLPGPLFGETFKNFSAHCECFTSHMNDFLYDWVQALLQSVSSVCCCDVACAQCQCSFFAVDLSWFVFVLTSACLAQSVWQCSSDLFSCSLAVQFWQLQSSSSTTDFKARQDQAAFRIAWTNLVRQNRRQSMIRWKMTNFCEQLLHRPSALKHRTAPVPEDTSITSDTKHEHRQSGVLISFVAKNLRWCTKTEISKRSSVLSCLCALAVNFNCDCRHLETLKVEFIVKIVDAFDRRDTEDKWPSLITQQAISPSSWQQDPVSNQSVRVFVICSKLFVYLWSLPICSCAGSVHTTEHKGLLKLSVGWKDFQYCRRSSDERKGECTCTAFFSKLKPAITADWISLFGEKVLRQLQFLATWSVHSERCKCVD